ncbi:hypothetical protein ES703_83132 [subsurface metagenome]
MGQRMDDIPIEFGADCSECWPPDETPKYLYARFSIVKRRTDQVPDVCLTPPNDRVFKLTQDPLEPCAWFYDQAGWTVRFDLILMGPGNTWLYLDDDPGNHYYSSVTPSCYQEGTVLHNDFDGTEPIRCGYNGLGIVTWNPQATKLLSDINMSKASDLFMELRPLEDGKLVYKFCRLQDATNIKILFEP